VVMEATKGVCGGEVKFVGRGGVLVVWLHDRSCVWGVVVVHFKFGVFG